MKTKAEELYEEWSGKDRHVNDCHPVHDSTETIEFAEYYHNNITNLRQIIHLTLRYQKRVTRLNDKGHMRPYSEYLDEVVELIKSKLNE